MTETSNRSASAVGTVLVVEDNEETLNILSRTLAAGGFEVLWARDAADTAKILDRDVRPIDLIVVDVVLPDTSAADLVAAVSARFPDVRTVFVSAHDGETVRSYGVDPDTMPFLHKPCEPADLLKLVQRTLAQA